MITRLSGRPREFDEGAVLLQAMEVFWAAGYEGTSLRDLVRASRINKGSLYAAFGNKRRLYLKALELYLDRLVAMVSEVLLGPSPVSDRLGALLEGAANRAAAGDRRGCFLCNASTDTASADPEVERLVRSGLGRLERLFFDALAPVVDDSRREDEARRLLSIYVGVQSLARAGYPPQSLRAIIEMTKAAVNDGEAPSPSAGPTRQ